MKFSRANLSRMVGRKEGKKNERKRNKGYTGAVATNLNRKKLSFPAFLLISPELPNGLTQRGKSSRETNSQQRLKF